MVKKHKLQYVSCIVIGLVIWAAFSLFGTDDYNSGLLSGMGTVLIVVGVIRLVRLNRVTKDPEKAADYETANQDERIRYIASKARAVVFTVSIYTELAAGLIVQFAFGQRLLSMVLCYLVCFQCLLFAALYRYYSKKY